MVGHFGEVQVVDWGFAKVLERGGVADERRATVMHSRMSIIETIRSAGSDTQSIAGSVMGTPAYMPPEVGEAVGDRFEGYLLAPRAGEYELWLECAEPVRLEIAGETVLEVDPQGATTVHRARVALDAGLNPIRTDCVVSPGGPGIAFRFGPAGGPLDYVQPPGFVHRPR